MLTQLVSVLESSNSILARFILKKVHSFLAVSPRLLDVRGRNGWLVVGRKLLSIILSKTLNVFGCNGHVLRYGGNEVRVLGLCGDGVERASLNICRVARYLANVYYYLVSPASLSFVLERGCRKLYSYTPLSHSVGARLSVGGERGELRVVCGVCGDVWLGVARDEHIERSRLVEHVVREEKSLCIRDLFYRLLGRTLNSPIILSIVEVYGGSRAATPCPSDPDAVCGVFEDGDGGVGVRLWFRAYRHPVGERRGCVLDDVMRVGVEVDVEGKILGVEYTVAGIAGFRVGGLPRDLVERLRVGSAELVGMLRKALEEGWWGRVEDLVEELRGRVKELVGELVEKLRTSIESCRECSGARFGELTEHLSKLLTGDIRVHVVPMLWPETQPGKAVDLELTMVNLGGEVEVLDLDTVALFSQTNAVAFIRGDGDRFGTITTPKKLYRVVGERVEGLRKAFESIGLERESLVYAWDYMVEKHMWEYLKNTLLLEALLGGRLLVVYVGGDENLFIAPIEGNTPYERVERLFEKLEVFRKLLLYTLAKPIASVAGCSVGDVVEVLKSVKVGTLTSAIVTASPKFPSYFAVSVLDEGLEAGKEVQRDSILTHTLTSIELEWVSRRWVEEAIAPLIPARENVSREVARAYRVFYLSSEIVDVVRGVLDYCVRRRLDWRECFDEISSTIDTVYASKETLFDPLRRIARSIASLGLPRPGYASFELMKQIERGVG